MASINELNDFVRFWAGDLDQCTISDDSLNMIIDFVLQSGKAENDCQEKYYCTLETLRWLDRKYKAPSSSSAGGLKKRSEKVGEVSVSEEYLTGEESNGDSSWADLIQDLESNPSLIGCNPFPSQEGETLGHVVIGGGDINGYDEGYETKIRQSQSAYKYKNSGLFPWKPTHPDRRVRR